MMQNRHLNMHGFSLIELTIAIVIIGILITLSMQSMDVAISNARQTGTEREMEMLAEAITGNPSLTTEGIRSDFGYFGDIGAFPPNLDALKSNPGSYSTWNGPYIHDQFTEDANGFKLDEWGKAYSYTGGVTITSNGGPTTITKKIADATSDYLNNTLNGNIVDQDNNVPGAKYFDSVLLVMTIPDGTGGVTTASTFPDSAGAFTLTSLPAGTHPLDIIFVPNVDTIHRFVTILPRHRSSKTYAFTSSYFDTSSGGVTGSGSIVYVNGTASVSGSDCNKIKFKITNTSGGPITLTGMTPSWPSPTAFYEEIKYNNEKIFKQENPLASNGSLATFTAPQTINAGETVTLRIDDFEALSSGGADVNMTNVNITVTFSDGSVITFNSGSC